MALDIINVLQAGPCQDCEGRIGPRSWDVCQATATKYASKGHMPSLWFNRSHSLSHNHMSIQGYAGHLILGLPANASTFTPLLAEFPTDMSIVPCVTGTWSNILQSCLAISSSWKRCALADKAPQIPAPEIDPELRPCRCFRG